MSKANMYPIKRAVESPPREALWDDPFWEDSEIAMISHFREEGSDHKPRTEAKLQWDSERLHVIFRVSDSYIRAVTVDFCGPVYEDSCVEFFVKPLPGAGYFNIEMNCVGAFLLYHIRNHERTKDGFADYTKVSPEDVTGMEVATSLPKGVIIDPEITEPLTWCVQYSVPFSLFSKYMGKHFIPGDGKKLMGNLYKCGDKTSHPHWGSWSKVGGEMNFHQPEYFGDFILMG